MLLVGFDNPVTLLVIINSNCNIMNLFSVHYIVHSDVVPVYLDVSLKLNGRYNWLAEKVEHKHISILGQVTTNLTGISFLLWPDLILLCVSFLLGLVVHCLIYIYWYSTLHKTDIIVGCHNNTFERTCSIFKAIIFCHKIIVPICYHWLVLIASANISKGLLWKRNIECPVNLLR